MDDLLTLPRLGETMEEGRVVSWLKKPGESFRRGETLVEIETDKTVVELPAVFDGRLGEIFAPEGTQVTVGAPLCRTSGAGSTARAEPESVLPAAIIAEVPFQPEQAAATRGFVERQRATPLARRLARRAGLDLGDIIGRGRRGRIEADDVCFAANLSGAPVAIDEEPRREPPGERFAFLDAPTGRLAHRFWQPEGVVRGTALLLHGFAGDHQIWSGLAPSLVRAGFRVVAPDLPGHGETTVPAAKAADLAEPLVRLLHDLGPDPVDLVGHSLGCVPACALARLHPNRVRSVTMIAPAGLGEEIDADFVQRIAAVTLGGALGHLLRRLAVRPPALSRERLEEMAAGLGGTGRLRLLADDLAADGRQGIDIRPDLDAIAVPIRIVWGLDDGIIPWRHALNAPSRVACHFVRGAGHMPHWDDPAGVAAIITAAIGR